MYCTVSKLDTLFNEEKNAYPVETLVNSPDEDLSGSPNENKWSFNKDTLVI